MYGARDKRLVLPLSFLTNLVSTQMTHSKMLCSMFGNLTPGGGYTHMATWVNKATQAVPIIPDVDLTYAADNLQIIGKNWHLEANSSQPVSVITNHIYNILRAGTNLQFNDTYHPRVWFPQKSDVKEISMTPDEESVYRALRLEFIETRLKRFNENKETNESVENWAGLIKRSRTVKYCTACYCENDKDFLVCRYCSSPLEGVQISLDATGEKITLGDYFPNIEKPVDAKPDICVCDPTFTNPNSYVSVSELLREIGRWSPLLGHSWKKNASENKAQKS
eukprot:TCONS_00069162-protein